MKKFFHSSLIIASLAMVLGFVMQSCGSKSSNQVPADATMVVTLNLNRVIENAGASVDDKGNITLPADLETDAQVKAMSSMMSSFVAPFELNDMVLYTRSANMNEGFVGIVNLRDRAAAIEKLNSVLGQSEKESGFEVYKANGVTFAVKDNTLYAASSLADITEGIKAAKKESFESMGAVNDYLHQGKAIAMVVNGTGKLPGNYADSWVCLNFDVEDQSLTGEFIMMNVDGKRVDFGSAIDVVSTDFLRYLPANTQSVMAFGQITDPNIKATLKMLANQMGPMADAINGLDGTIAFALGTNDQFDALEFTKKLRNEELDLKGLDLMLMARYTQAALPNVIDGISQLAGQLGKVEGNTFTVDDQKFYFGSADSYAIVSTQPISADSQNEFAPLVEGKRAVIASYAEPGNNPFGFEFGSKGALWLETDAVKLNATVTNTDKGFIAVMLEVLENPQVQAQILEAIEQVESAGLAPALDDSFGGYDDDAAFNVD